MVLQEAASHLTGAVGQQRVPADFLHKLKIPLPPVDEQKRLVGWLNEKFAAVNVAREAVIQQIKVIDKLPTALLHKACLIIVIP